MKSLIIILACLVLGSFFFIQGVPMLSSGNWLVCFFGVVGYLFAGGLYLDRKAARVKLPKAAE